MTRQSKRRTCSTGTRRRTNSRHKSTDTACETTVAMAAPPTPHSSGPTMRITSPTFSAHAIVRNTSGVRESPIARMIAAR